MSANAVTVLYSYSHKDETYREQLETHLAILKRRGLIEDWHFRKIIPGQEPDAEIEEAMGRAQLFLVLVSSDFLASDYCWDVELRTALERRASGEAEVIPIILRPVDLQGAPFEHLQALPTDRRPVSTWSNVDEAWLSVAKGIRAAAENLVTLAGESKGGDLESEDGIELSEADFGIIDFRAEFEGAMEFALEIQVRMNERTEAASAAMEKGGEKIRQLTATSPPDISRRARLIAGSLAAELTTYASHVDDNAMELKSTWDRVDRYFPRMLEAVVGQDLATSYEVTELRDTLVDSRERIAHLREMILGTDEQLQVLGTFAAALKIGTRRTHKALSNLADVYWEIENSIGQMISRVEGLLN